MSSFVSVVNCLRSPLIKTRIECSYLTLVQGKKYLSWPNDWLPFNWERPEPPIGYFATGDPEETVVAHPDRFRAGYEFLEHEESVPEEVKRQFRLGNSRRFYSSWDKMKEKVSAVRRHPMDETSHETRIARYTTLIRVAQDRIRYIAPNDVKSKVIANYCNLKRTMLLNEMSRMDRKRYDAVVKALGIEHTPSVAGVPVERIERKRTLRQLTQTYCDDLKEEKIKDLKMKLKEEQKNFLVEKAETMLWMEKEMAANNIKEDDLKKRM